MQEILNSCTELASSWTGHFERPAIAHFKNWALEAPSSWIGRFHRLGITYLAVSSPPPPPNPLKSKTNDFLKSEIKVEGLHFLNKDTGSSHSYRYMAPATGRLVGELMPEFAAHVYSIVTAQCFSSVRYEETQRKHTCKITNIKISKANKTVHCLSLNTDTIPLGSSH